MQFPETVLKSACVLFMKNRLNLLLQKALTGFVVGHDGAGCGIKIKK